MSTYLQTDFLNEPFKLELTKKVMISKILSGADKTRIKAEIKKMNFINKLRTKFNKGVYLSDDINAVIEFLKGAN